MCLGKLLGGGVSTPEVQKVNPTPTTVTATDAGSGSGSGDSEALKKQKKKQGYAATQIANDTIAGSSGGKTTLG